MNALLPLYPPKTHVSFRVLSNQIIAPYRLPGVVLLLCTPWVPNTALSEVLLGPPIHVQRPSFTRYLHRSLRPPAESNHEKSIQLDEIGLQKQTIYRTTRSRSPKPLAAVEPQLSLCGRRIDPRHSGIACSRKICCARYALRAINSQ